MSNYCTRGTKCGSSTKSYDVRFNKGFKWSLLFDFIAMKMVKNIARAFFTGHVFDRIDFDECGNREFLIEELQELISSPLNLTLVEMEAIGISLPDGEIAFVMKKLLLRGPEREDGESICIVLDFNNPIYPRVKTAYLNKAYDNHDTGLDIHCLDTCINHIFGFENRWGETELFSEAITDEGKHIVRKEGILC